MNTAIVIGSNLGDISLGMTGAIIESVGDGFAVRFQDATSIFAGTKTTTTRTVWLEPHEFIVVGDRAALSLPTLPLLS